MFYLRLGHKLYIVWLFIVIFTLSQIFSFELLVQDISAMFWRSRTDVIPPPYLHMCLSICTHYSSHVVIMFFVHATIFSYPCSSEHVLLIPCPVDHALSPPCSLISTFSRHHVLSSSCYFVPVLISLERRINFSVITSYTQRLPPHTHTHTHIFMYIYIYI